MNIYKNYNMDSNTFLDSSLREKLRQQWEQWQHNRAKIQVRHDKRHLQPRRGKHVFLRYWMAVQILTT
jgi:hypothetical protein